MRGACLRRSGVSRALLAFLAVSNLAASAPAAEIAVPWTGLPESLGPGAVALPGEATGAFGNPALLASEPAGAARADAGLDARGTPWQRLGLHWPTVRDDAIAVGLVRTERDGQQQHSGSVAYGRRVGAGFDLGSTVELRTQRRTAGRSAGFGMHVGAAFAPHVTRGMTFGLRVRNAISEDAGLQSEPAGLEAGVARGFALGDAWTGTVVAGWEATRGRESAAWIGARLGWANRVAASAAGRRGAFRSGARLRLGAVHFEYAFESADIVRHVAGVRVPLGAPVAERRLAASAGDDSLLEARIQREIEARHEQAVAMRLTQAQAALESGAFDRASELFREVLLWSPAHPAGRDGLRRAQRGALLVQADSSMLRADWWSATSQLEHVARLFPEDSVATAKLVEVRTAMHRADRTRGEAAEQLRSGLDAYAAQRYSAAARCFEAVLQLDPASEMAGEFLQRSRLARQEQFGKALARARGRLEKRDPEGARAALAPALADAPAAAEVQRLADQIEREIDRQAEERRVAEARDKAAAAREDRAPAVSTPRLVAAYDRGMQLFRAGDLAAAMAAWEDVARQAPHFDEVDRYLLRVYRVVGLESYTEGRLQDAIDIWTKALLLEPNNSQVRRYLDQANAKLQRAQNPGGER